MVQTRLRSHRLLFSLLSIYLFIYPWAILLIALDRVPVWGTWMGGALLILQGTMMGVWLADNYGRRGTLAALLILLISWSIEHVGETTSFPFGSYDYTDVLSPKLWGVVPLAIPFAWLLVVPAAIGVTDRLMGRHRLTFARGLLMVLGAASFATLLDVTIEPVAVHIKGYWTWDHRGGYYGIPASNFAAWWATSVLLVSIVLWLRQSPVPTTGHPLTERLQSQPNARLTWLPLLLYLLNLTMFVLVNLAHGQIGAAAIGGVILGYLAFDWVEPAVVRWVMGVEPGNGRQPEV